MRPRCSPFPHQRMNIPQAEHGGNGESGGVVNQWLLFGGPSIHGSRDEALTCRT